MIGINSLIKIVHDRIPGLAVDSPGGLKDLVRKVADHFGFIPPQSLKDAVVPLALYFSTRPEQFFRHAQIFGITPDQVREVFGRELRHDRLLPERRHEIEMVLLRNLHTRPAVILCRTLQKYPNTRVWIRRGTSPQEIPLRPSIIELIPLALRRGERITWIAQGPTAKKLLRQLEIQNEKDWGTERTYTYQVHEIPHLPMEEVVNRVCAMMDLEGVEAVSGMYDIDKDRLWIAPSEMSHNEIMEAAGIQSPFNMTRINFERSEGVLKATFSADDDFEGMAYFPLRKWLGTLLTPTGVLLKK